MRIRLYNSIYIKFLSVFLVVFILSMIGALLYATFIQKTNIEESLKDIISKEFLEIEKHIDKESLSIDEATEKISKGVESRLINQFRNVQQRAFIVPVVLGIGILMISLKIVTKPIKELSNAAQNIAKGDFDIEIKSRGKNEISELICNFNLMVKALKTNEYLHKDFVSNVSHEFNTPISSLTGYAKLLKKKDIKEKQKNEYLDIIITECKRLSSLSSKLLQLAELENEVIRHKKQNFSLTEQIRTAVLLLQGKWEEKRINIEFDTSDEIYFTGDKELLFQVWVNILSNAIKYTDIEGMIKVLIKKEENIVVEITDDGIGLTEEEAKRVFQRFYKAEKDRNSSGTGLGLSIAKKIIEIHNGKIRVMSHKGKGTTFSITL